MKLFRNPIKAIAGVLLIVLAVTLLISGASQFASTQLTRENLSDGYSTVASISGKYYQELIPGGGVYQRSYIVDEDAREWAETIPQTRTDLFQGDSYTEVYSAYVPELIPDNIFKYGNCSSGYTYRMGNPYRSAMLEVTLTAVGSLRGGNCKTVLDFEGNFLEFQQYVTMLCTGTVENVIGLESGFSSPVGKTIAFIIKVYSDEELNAINPEIGQRYLIYGMDYCEDNSDAGAIQWQIKDTENEPLFDELFGNTALEQTECFMTVYDFSSIPALYSDENGYVFREDIREYNYKDGDVVITTYIPTEEYIAKYATPTIVKLEGASEDFLNSEEGALWRQTLEDMAISNHGFPVMAVDKAGYQMEFARENARIVYGRDFSETERKESSKVCIISETVASLNNLTVGDKLNLQTYALDDNIQAQASERTASAHLNGWIYSHAMGFTSEMEEYEIVGIYRQNNAWENVDDPYGFTPNTIFVTKGSISGDARTGTKGIFYTLVLHNGKMEELQKLQNEAGYPDLFLCFDQGYSDIVEALSAYEGVSERAFYIGIAGCAVIMLLFLVLFPLQQGRNLAIMSSLGAPRGKRIGFIVGSSLGILLPGVVIGGTAGALLWKQVAAKLMESVNVLIPMNADTVVLSVSISVALLAIMLLAVTLIAIAISGDKGLSRRK